MPTNDTTLAMGAALFANVVSFVGISYWDQTAVAWYALLSMITAARIAVPAESTAAAPMEAVPVELNVPLSPAHVSQAARPVNSYGRMVTGRWPPRSATK